jgi:hypothetical protein
MGVSTAPDVRTRRLVLTPAAFLFGACVIYAVLAASIGWHNTVLDFIGFRQTQTALTAYFMIGQPPKLAYETPVVGPPWSIPFEFPIYQWAVAAVVTLFDTPLDETGRFVSLTFFLLTLFPAYRLLGWMGICREHRLLALSLLIVSPFYVFWSRTFLIESTALFFSMAYLAAALPSVDCPRPGRLIGAAFLGGLAAMVKITTFLVFLPLVLLYLGYSRLWQEHRRKTVADVGRTGVLGLLLAVVPCASGWLWTKFADSQKALNPIGQRLLSTGDAMYRWNFGTLEQRCSLDTWETVYGHAQYAVGHGAVFGLAVLAMVLTRRHWRLFAACLFAYPMAPLVFTNLYWFHEYYAYANNILLLAAVALALVGLLECGGIRRKLALLGLVLCLASAVWRHQDYYLPIQTSNHRELEAVSRAVQEVTQPNEVIVVIGCDWSSEMAYYCRRRALSLPAWEEPSLAKMPDYLALGPYSVGAVVIRNARERYDPADVEGAIRSAGYEARHLRIDDDFDVYVIESLHAGIPEGVPVGTKHW